MNWPEGVAHCRSDFMQLQSPVYRSVPLIEESSQVFCSSEVGVGGGHDVGRRERARAPTTSEPSIVLATRVVQTRRLPLAVAGEHDRQNTGLRETTVAGLRHEEFGQNGKGTGRMEAVYL